MRPLNLFVQEVDCLGMGEINLLVSNPTVKSLTWMTKGHKYFRLNLLKVTNYLF
jgi:hypothetical protein